MSISYQDALQRLQSVARNVYSAGRYPDIGHQGPLNDSGRHDTESNDNPSKLHITNALGAVSAQDVVGTRTLPPYDNSAMDGYVVTSEETVHASQKEPVRLRVLGSIAAGDQPILYSLRDTPPLSCYTINTGGPFPLCSANDATTSTSTSTSRLSRFDACLRKEDAILYQNDGHSYIQVNSPVRPGQDRRLAGEDFQPGCTILRRGDRITPERIAALSSHGVSHIECVPPMRIAIVSTGKELDPLDQEDTARSSHIHDSNSYYIQTTLKRDNQLYNVVRHHSIGDDSADFEATIAHHILGKYNVLITTGGVSKGQHDYVEATLLRLGATIHFHGVRMRPGHPVLMATLEVKGHTPLTVFGLPGNPCAAAATLRFLVDPFLRACVGRPPEEPLLMASLLPPSSVQNSKSATKHSGLHPGKHANGTDNGSCGQHSRPHRSYVLGRFEGFGQNGVKLVRALARGSGLVKPLSEADCWFLVDEDQKEQEGLIVGCYLFDVQR